MKAKETSEQLHQRILDRQGYIVTYHYGPGRDIGEVIDSLTCAGNGDLMHPTVVQAEATLEEFAAQHLKYWGTPMPAWIQGACCKFYKVVAE